MARKPEERVFGYCSSTFCEEKNIKKALEQKIGSYPFLTKQDTVMRKTITVREKLALILHYFTTGT